MSEQPDTEALIKKTAKCLLFQKGYVNATTQEIADEAGINRALIHYYFRSREQLIDTLIREVLDERKERYNRIMTSPVSLQEKIKNFLDEFMERAIQNPHLENFIISEMARQPEKLKYYGLKSAKTKEILQQQLEEEIKKGTVASISLEHFMINLSSMCNYPLLARPILQSVYGMSDTAYKKFLLERKEVILNTLFKS